MKKGLFYVGMMVVAMGFATSNVNAQDDAAETGSYTLPEMQVIGVTGGAPSLTLVAPGIGGAVIGSKSSNTSYIDYTSVISVAIPTNKVTVAITTGTVPAGTTLQVFAGTYAGTGGDGNYGTPVVGAITLGAIALDLIETIGSCHTGTNGHQLTYTWSVNDDGYADLVAPVAAVEITATYTITATI